MKIYPVAGGYVQAMRAVESPHVLIALPYQKEIRKLKYRPEGMMLDSGAFSAWNVGETVSLDRFHAWVESIEAGTVEGAENLAPERIYINLDVIPGKKGSVPSRAEKKKAVEEGFANADEIRTWGVPMMEVFHQGEPPAILDKIISRRRPGDVIGISARKDLTLRERREWIGQVFSKLLSEHPLDRFPPCHGLGCSNRGLIWNFPWISVDSSAWVAASKFGITTNRLGSPRKDSERNTGSAGYRILGCQRVLELWAKWEIEIGEMWERRGVRLED